MVPFNWKIQQRLLARRWTHLTEQLKQCTAENHKGIQQQIITTATAHAQISAKIAQRTVGAA